MNEIAFAGGPMRKLFMSILLVAVLSVLTACQGGISGNDAKSAVAEMALCIADGRYEDAQALCHPAYDITADELAEYVSECATELGVNFTDGIEIQQYTIQQGAYYDSEVDGSFYALTATVRVGKVTLQMDVELVKNDRGYGISFLRFTSDESNR